MVVIKLNYGEQMVTLQEVFSGGTGAYTSGNITLTAGEKIYVYVGGAGNGDMVDIMVVDHLH